MEKFFSKGIMAFAAIAMTACSSNDLFDAGAIENDLKKDYTENFVNKYPNVSLNQNWDYSSKTPVLRLGKGSNKAATRAAGEGEITKTDKWYEVDNETLYWMQNTLKEGENNGSLGNAFVMSAPNSDFTIVPIFQGFAGAIWNFHVVIDGVDYKIWDKSEGIEVQDDGNANKGEWYPIKGIKTYEWGADGTTWASLENTIGDRYDEFFTKYDEEGNLVGDNEKNEARTKVKVTATRAKEIQFSGLPVGAEMYFYLEITQGDQWDGQILNVEGEKQTSVDHMMLALNCPKPNNIPDGYKSMIIGCEDVKKEYGDWDYNDVVFLVYGKDIPKPLEITEGDVIKETTTVRYMIEDLGATDDFDFNDIVVDVENVKEKKAKYVNGKLINWEYGATYQKAYIRHLGGTLPFTLTIGNTTLPEIGGHSSFQSSPNTEFDVTGWTGWEEGKAHNISVMVEQKGNAGVYNTVGFPKAGEAPMIVAFDKAQNWMPERQSVPEDWFVIPETAE